MTLHEALVLILRENDYRPRNSATGWGWLAGLWLARSSPGRSPGRARCGGSGNRQGRRLLDIKTQQAHALSPSRVLARTAGRAARTVNSSREPASPPSAVKDPSQL